MSDRDKLIKLLESFSISKGQAMVTPYRFHGKYMVMIDRDEYLKWMDVLTNIVKSILESDNEDN